jgi:hypothetical protein
VCGRFGSWHCGHSLIAVGRNASCVRRLAVRDFECRRLGFGIVGQPITRRQASYNKPASDNKAARRHRV